MRKRKLFAVVLCGLLALGAVGGAAGCASSSEVVSGTEEEAQENAAGFYGTLGYVSEKDDKLGCTVVLTAQNGTFAEDAAAEDITFGGGFQEASGVRILENTKDAMQVGFALPKNDLDADDLSIDGSIELKEGVLLDAEGQPAGVKKESAEYTFQALDEKSIHPGNDNSADIYLTVKHKGAYIADFEIWKSDHIWHGEPLWDYFSSRTYSGMPAGYKEMLKYTDIIGLEVNAWSRTGLIWEKDPHRTAIERQFDLDLLKEKNHIIVTLGGTSLHPTAKVTYE